MATTAANGVAAAPPPVTFTAMKSQVFVETSKVNDAVAFYKSAFGAEEVSRVSQPKRKADQELPLLLSAELKLGSSTILISGVVDDATTPVKATGTRAVFLMETDDIEGAVQKAVKAGAVAESKVTEGEGACCEASVGEVKDPYGILWVICTPCKMGGDVEA